MICHPCVPLLGLLSMCSNSLPHTACLTQLASHSLKLELLPSCWSYCLMLFSTAPTNLMYICSWLIVSAPVAGCHHACAKHTTRVIWPKAPVVAVFFMMIIVATILLTRFRTLLLLPVWNLIVGVLSMCSLGHTCVTWRWNSNTLLNKQRNCAAVA